MALKQLCVFIGVGNTLYYNDHHCRIKDMFLDLWNRVSMQLFFLGNSNALTHKGQLTCLGKYDSAWLFYNAFCRRRFLKSQNSTDVVTVYLSLD